jgi:predicted nicotinamide N-methyase
MCLWTINDLEVLQEALQSPKDIALLRHKELENDDVGFASKFVPILQHAFNAWLKSLVLAKPPDELKTAVCTSTTGTAIAYVGFDEEKKEETLIVPTSPSKTRFAVHETMETNTLARVLQLHVTIAQNDPTLSEELGREGSHALLSKLIRYDPLEHSDCEEDQDAVMELQDLACEIAACCSASFPLRVAPYSSIEMRQRLPLCIELSSESKHNNHNKVLIRQVTSRQSAQEDVGFVLWPSAVALSQWLLKHPEIVQSAQCIMEIGAGCGLVGLLAAQLQHRHRSADESRSCRSTILTDFNPVVLDNLQLNIDLNGVASNATVKKLDFYKQTGDTIDHWVGGSDDSPQEPVDLILAADMICQPSDAVAAANSIHDALVSGGTAVVVCADGKHRFGVDCFEDECRRVGLTVVTSDVDVDNMESMNLAAGYVEGMTLTMFTIEKLQDTL